MAKPILIIRMPHNFKCGKGNVGDNNNQSWVRWQQEQRQLFIDYHVFFDTTVANNTHKIEFECINPDNIPSKDIGEIKKIGKKFKLF
jgi:hypothetical protein